MTVHVSVQPKKIAGYLGLAVGALVAANVVVNLAKLLVAGDLYGFIPLFALNAEGNIPTFFSGLLLILNAALFAVVWMLHRQSSRWEWVWLAFSTLFLFLAFDELFQVHEKLIEPVRNSLDTTGLLYFAWVLVYGVAVLAIVAVFLPRWWRLEAHIRWWMAASGVIYLTGAIVFEMVGGAVYEASGQGGGVVYALLYTVEETLEMIGLVMLTYTLLNLILSVAPGLHLNFVPAGPVRSSAINRLSPVSTPPPATRPPPGPAQTPISAPPPLHRGARMASPIRRHPEDASRSGRR